MPSQPISLARSASLLALSALVGCSAPDPLLYQPTSRGSEGVLTATVRIGSSSSLFVADEAQASLSASPRGRELVIFARSYDQGETLAFVLDLAALSANGPLDLSNHGVLYLEPGSSLGGGELLFDGVPQGTLELDGVIAGGGSLSGRFSVTVPGYDPSHASDELAVSLEGSFSLQVVYPAQ